MELYSVVINWNDCDPEQGTFGTTVRARDAAHAEALARAQMRASLAEERDCDLGGIDDEVGSCVECGRGAYWRAADLEQALRDVLSCTSQYKRYDDLLAAEDRAKAVLAGLDQYDGE
jgi:hypothetical protein